MTFQKLKDIDYMTYQKLKDITYQEIGLEEIEGSI